MPPPGYGPPQPRSKLPLVGGIFLILGAIILFVDIALVASALNAVGNLASDTGASTAEVEDAMTMLWVQCVVLPLLGAIFFIIAAAFSFMHKKFMLVVVFGIMGIIFSIIGSFVSIGGLLIPNTIALVGFIFGLIGFILAAAGKKGFD
jgi:hypothetical protein